MAFSDLTGDQRELITRLVEELESGNYKKQFLTVWEQAESRWSFFLRRQDGSSTRLPASMEPTDFETFKELKYLITVQHSVVSFECSLTQRAFTEYEFLKRPPVEPPVPSPHLRATSVGFPELAPFVQLFGNDHPDPQRSVFLMMKYQETTLHDRIVKTVRDTCTQHAIQALRADDKRYSDDLLANVRTYMHGCSAGIAVIERLPADEFNPNVSLEVGYMMAQGKPVCLLKDNTLTSLQTDLVGRLYDPFDTHDPETTIPPVLEKWLKDKGIA